MAIGASGTDKGEIAAEIVVNAAGYRAGEIMALLGRTLPVVSISHQYLVTAPLPELTQRKQRLPLLRDPDVSWYMRQEVNGLLLGPYEWQATPMWLDGIPTDFSFQLWNEDLERLGSIIEAAIERVPLLGTVGVRRVVNGPIPYSPDGNPYLGPEHGLRNFFHCNTFSFGITQAGGAGKCTRRMGSARPPRMGRLLARSAALYRLRGPDLHRGKGGRGLSERIRPVLPIRGTPSRPPMPPFLAVYTTARQGRTLRSAWRLGTRGVLRH